MKNWLHVCNSGHLEGVELNVYGESRVDGDSPIPDLVGHGVPVCETMVTVIYHWSLGWVVLY